MRASRLVLLLALLVAVATPAMAINPGTDVVIPAAYKGSGAGGSQWVTDVYVYNPGSSTANVTVYWLERGKANSNPVSATFTVQPGATAVLADIIGETFSTSGGGAFRVVSTADVVVNAAILNQAGGTEFGQGFEGIPVAAAITAGGSTDAMGLASNDVYRTNFYLMDVSGTGSSVTVSLLDASGTALASRTYNLKAWDPILPSITDIGAGSFSYATLHVVVNSGAAVAGASRVNNSSGDALTLQSWWDLGGGGGAVGGPGVYTGYVAYTYEGGVLIDVTDTGSGYAIDYVSGSLVLFSPDDGGTNCASVFGYSATLDTPFALDSGGNFTGTFQVQFQSGSTLTFDWSGLLSEDTLYGTLDVNVSGGASNSCSGDMNTANFYTGHTLLTLN